MSDATMEQANLEKTVSEIHRLNEETRKLIRESHKLTAETDKKVKWYEVTILLVIVAATVAVTKVFF